MDSDYLRLFVELAKNNKVGGRQQPEAAERQHDDENRLLEASMSETLSMAIAVAVRSLDIEASWPLTR